MRYFYTVQHISFLLLLIIISRWRSTQSEQQAVPRFLSSSLRLEQMRTTKKMRPSRILLLLLMALSVVVVSSQHHNAKHRARMANLLPHDNAETDGYTHAAYLDANNYVLLKWTVKSVKSTSSQPDVLVAELTAPARGYVAFGVSPNGGMPGASMLVMWVDADTGRAHLQDRYATAFAEPLLNDEQSEAVLAFEGRENATHTVVTFARWLSAECKGKRGLSITSSAVRVIYAYSDEDPSAADGHIKYHGTENRGSQTMYLIDDINGSVERDKAAALAQTTLILNYTAREPSNLDILHHFVVHDCDVDFDEPPPLKSFECHNTSPTVMGENLAACFMKLIWGWGVGGVATYLPEQVGIRLNRRDSRRYFVIATHYNNPALAAGRTDSSGFRMLLTHKLRPADASSFVVGAPPNEALTIPGSTPAFTVPGFCHEKCTEKFIPSQGTNVFAVLLHSHLIGRSLVLRQFRDGHELPAISADLSYDFNYQQWRPTDVTILPGDRFVLECNYSSTEPELRRNSTMGGPSTRDEMCYAYLFVTPPVDMTECTSSADYEKLRVVLDFNDFVQPAYATWETYTEYKQKVQARIKAIDWPNNAPMQSKLVDLYLNQPHTWGCVSENSPYFHGTDKPMETWHPYTPPDECSRV